VADVEGANVLGAGLEGDRVVVAKVFGECEVEAGVTGFGIGIASVLGACDVGDRVVGDMDEGAGVTVVDVEEAIVL
jgi:hypothetical protein